MKTSKIISAVLALVLAVGSLGIFASQPVSARTITNVDKVNDDGDPLINYTSASPEVVYTTKEQKLEDMMEIKTVGDYRIWYEAFTGEVAIEEISTGHILFTNPYDLSDEYCTASASTKEELLSQISLTYLDNEKESTMYSYVEAAERGQITMKDIKDGIRVEYTLGEPAIQRLVPRWISIERFEKFVKTPLQEAIVAECEEKGLDPNDEYDIQYTDAWFAWSKIDSWYTLNDPDNPILTERQIKEMQNKYKITKTMGIYAFEAKTTGTELKKLEAYFKKYCPQYTYEELEYDNQETGFENQDKIPPRFTMALEYKITDNGVEVTLPANGISFDEELYQLQELTVLPYMGSGSNQFKGYTFLPDGSGTILRYEDLIGKTYVVESEMYGSDFAYHKIEDHQNAEPFRFPVFGAVTSYEETTDPKLPEEKAGYENTGYLAIITEGDSLATLTSDHGGALHPYNTVYATFTPRPSDTYNLADGGSGLAAAEWTVTSERKYTGRYTIKYVMLSGKDESGKGYDPSYFGMAEAYRDYLIDTGVLEKNENTGDKLPLFIESFGSMKGTKRVLSFPVSVDIPLTTFDDIRTMSDELKELGIDNLNFKLTGFANDGLRSTMPYKLSWQSSLGGSDGMEELAAYAKENGIGLYPEFDFAYITKKANFDGVNYKKHAVRTIDGRYAGKQEYDSGYQEYRGVGKIAVSPSVYSYFWDKFGSKLADYELGGISVASLGTDLNSDFDEDFPSHREDSKGYTEELLGAISENNKVMVSGGNAYSLKYADVVTDVALSSSEYIRASETVPFAGIVLHGSKVITGTPINMEGDMDEAVLNSIENGAAPFFTLSYQNTQELKADKYWNRYYSIAYENWKDGLVEYYNIMNEALGDLQGSYITSHEFIDALRVPDEDEKAEDDRLQAELDAENAELAEKAAHKLELAKKRAARLGTEAPNEREYTPEVKKIDLATKYKTQSGSVVRVGYEGGVEFILNYNSYDIEVELDGQTYTVEAMGFVRIG